MASSISTSPEKRFRFRLCNTRIRSSSTVPLMLWLIAVRFLELTREWIIEKQVLLYDEADNLLESRMLKANEVVDSGERLTFQAYLVDVCEPSNPSEHSVHQPKPFAVLRPNFKKSSPYSRNQSIISLSFFPQDIYNNIYSTYFPFCFLLEDKKPNLAHSFASKNLSPSHKMIRGEFSWYPSYNSLQSVKIERCSLFMFSLYCICSIQRERTAQVCGTNSWLCYTNIWRFETLILLLMFWRRWS